MSVSSADRLDFSHAPEASGALRQTFVVRNPDPHAVLHIGVRTPVPYLELFPTEFALAPGEGQVVSATLRPERAGGGTLAAGEARLLGQYIALHEADASLLPPDIDLPLPFLLPGATCPHCGADLAEGASECRRCGERVRPCPVCGTPNSWLARVCRVSPAHILRAEPDWTHAPGGNAAHSLFCPAPPGLHLARRWTIPSFPRAGDGTEWAAPLLAFGMTMASWTDTAAGTARVGAWETAAGAALWEFALPGSQGLYPDRGALSLSSDGTLYAATLAGDVTALDVLRGTRRWAARVDGAVFGGVTVAGERLLVPAGSTLCILERESGIGRHVLPLGGRLDTAPAFADGRAFCACDDGILSAWDADTGQRLWEQPCGGPFDAAPLVWNGRVIAATMTGTVSAWDAATGAPIWQTNATGSPIVAAPCVSQDGLLLVGADDGHLHVLDAGRGHLLRSRRVADAPVRVGPACGGQTVFVGADDGSIYALDADWNVSRVYQTAPGTRIVGAGLALASDTLAFTATDGALYVCRAIP